MAKDTREVNGERRLMSRALNVLAAIMLTATLTMTGWMLSQVVQLKVNVASLTTAQKHVADRLKRLEQRLDAAGKVASHSQAF